MGDPARFWDKAAERYARRPIKDVPAYERTLERTRAYLGADDAVLEIGCGTGSTALLLARDVRQITASDISENMVEIARRKAAEQGAGNLRPVQAGLLDEALPAGPFDAVLAFNLLHLVEDLPAGLRRIGGRLRTGGLFLSKTPCVGEMRWFWRLLLPAMRALGLAPPVSVLTGPQLERAIAGAGFEIIETDDLPRPSRFVVARKL